MQEVAEELEVIDALAISFAEGPTAIREATDVEQPGWLPGATMNIVASCLDHDPDAIAIVAPGDDGVERVTVDELRRDVAAFAAGLELAGCGVGSRVAIAMSMTVEAGDSAAGTPFARRLSTWSCIRAM